ncbi:MAG TPA: N-acetylneuraminate synthase [Deltaproteobacteria bacterium]|nr:N-acetylneuraminate synthase [Deltaproteobacteria bacterium]HCY11532.1 N-acetylneuraminate synthase [Deltaproteobacteria bacterium]
MAVVAYKTFIIAEAGVNHNGSVETALELVDAAARAGADAVKFQTFRAAELASPSAKKADYQRRNTGAGGQLEMLRRLELDRKAHLKIMRRCGRKGIKFLSTPFDLDSIDLLAGLGLDIFKVPSGEITNLPYLRKIASLGRPVFLSTGMASLGEIEAAMGVLTRAIPKENITVLHCNTGYPTPFEDVNLRAMLTIREAFQVRVGYSDHTPGTEAAIAAVALGAEVIEKHLTLDRSMEGPDHMASIEPGEFGSMVRAIRNIEKAMGSPVKGPTPSEKENINAARKGIVASRRISAGEIFSEANLAVKRPQTGLSPMLWDLVVGKRANRGFEKDEPVELPGLVRR